AQSNPASSKRTCVAAFFAERVKTSESGWQEASENRRAQRAGDRRSRGGTSPCSGAAPDAAGEQDSPRRRRDAAVDIAHRGGRSVPQHARRLGARATG